MNRLLNISYLIVLIGSVAAVALVFTEWGSAGALVVGALAALIGLTRFYLSQRIDGTEKRIISKLNKVLGDLAPWDGDDIRDEEVRELFNGINKNALEAFSDLRKKVTKASSVGDLLNRFEGRIKLLLRNGTELLALCSDKDYSDRPVQDYFEINYDQAEAYPEANIRRIFVNHYVATHREYGGYFPLDAQEILRKHAARPNIEVRIIDNSEHAASVLKADPYGGFIILPEVVLTHRGFGRADLAYNEYTAQYLIEEYTRQFRALERISRKAADEDWLQLDLLERAGFECECNTCLVHGGSRCSGGIAQTTLEIWAKDRDKGMTEANCLAICSQCRNVRLDRAVPS